jgi:hypothetical protein
MSSKIERRLTERTDSTLLFQLKQSPLDGPDAGSRDVTIARGQLFGVVSDVLQHCPQIFQVEEQPASDRQRL